MKMIIGNVSILYPMILEGTLNYHCSKYQGLNVKALVYWCLKISNGQLIISTIMTPSNCETS